MRWLRRDTWKAGIAIAGMLLLLLFMVWVPVSIASSHEGVPGFTGPVAATAQATPTEDATVTALNKDKLKQETQQLENQNNRSPAAWFWNSSGLLGTVIAGLLAVAGVLATVVFNAQKERKDRETEREKRDEERFQKVVEGLGSERTEAKVGAAITLRTFLQPGYERFYRQAFDLAVAHLRLRKAEANAPWPLSPLDQVFIIPKGSLRQVQQPPPPTTSIPLDSLSQALITVFKESFPLARKGLQKPNAQFDPQLLDATNIQSDHAYLAGADLVQAWLVRASLREADLSRAQLEGANLFEAQLEGANLFEAQLEGANLFEARLKGAKLRLAQLKGADLRLAQLKGAKLRSAQFKGAKLHLAQLEGADLSWAQLEGANLRLAHLKGADLSWAQLKGTDLSWAQLEGAYLSDAQLEGANLSDAQLEGANLYGANPEEADSLKGTKMNGVTGLTPEQREKCLKKGALFDEVQQAPASVTSSPSSRSPAQSNETQAPSAPPTQVNTPTPQGNRILILAC
jgi:uncharacterized protein YjbI with pentapeptide repeats